MREFRLSESLERIALGSYKLPLGVAATSLKEPVQGYTVRFQEGTEEEPDTYVFHAVVSHERLRPIVDAAFNLLPREVTPVVEIGSRDAYRTIDTYVAEEPMPLVEFLRTWYEFEEILLEDVSIGVGANAEEPWIDVFVDSWKGILISVPVEMRDAVEQMFAEHHVTEVASTWDEELPDSRGDAGRGDPGVGSLGMGDGGSGEEGLITRDVLEMVDDHSPDIDELLLVLREKWLLELNVDRETNVDEAGRHLGMTLWHAIVLVQSADGEPDRGAYITVWMTAGSLAQAEELLEDALVDHAEWVFESIYTMDRVAYDDRPTSLSHLPPSRRRPAVHEVAIEPWGAPGSPGGEGSQGPGRGPELGPERGTGPSREGPGGPGGRGVDN